MHKLLAREEVAVGYTTLRRYVQRELGWRKKRPTVRLDSTIWRRGKRRRSTLG